MSYIGLHNHSDYSNLRLRDSTNKIPELIEYAYSLGHKGIAITEHDTIASSIVAQEYFNSKNFGDFKLILGNEIYLMPKISYEHPSEQTSYLRHFILLALDEDGHKQIRELSTKAWMHSYMDVMMRVPTYYQDLVEIIGNNQGHVVGSTACLGGALPTQLLQQKQDEKDNKDQLIQWINFMISIFGKDKFFLELQPSFNEEQIYVNNELVKLSHETGIDYIITTDSHYLKKEDRPIHKAFLTSQKGDREVDEFYDSTYVMSEAEIHSYMDESLTVPVVSIGIENTMKIYSMAMNFDMKRPLRIPYVPLDRTEPDGNLFIKYKDKIEGLTALYISKYDSDRHLVRELLKAIDKKEEYQNEKTYKAISNCFDALQVSSEKMNVRWSAYLLSEKDLVDIAWTKGDSLVGAGRGSGVGFILLNILGITDVNPLREKTQTFPWRFLNPERVSVLDIDVDIEGAKREQVVQALRDTYGEDRISKVATFGTETSKSAILTACRGLDVDVDIAMYLSSLVVADRGQLRTLQQMYYGDKENDFKSDPNFVSSMNEYPEVWKVAQNIEGLINSMGSHAGGIVLTDEPFTEVSGLMKTNSGDIVTQFD